MSELVFKIMKAGRSFHAIDYNDRKEARGQARLLHWQGFGEWQDGRTRIDGRTMTAFLERQAGRNPRVTHPQFHAILSSRGESVPLERMQERALALLDALGYGRNPILLYSHADTRHRHLHIVSCRVDPEGRKINDRFEGIRAGKVLQQLEGVDTARAFGRDLEEALGYRFGTLRQFALLMEMRGYRSRKEGGDLRFFRHGSVQGSVSLERIERQRVTGEEMGAARIRGLILAHRQAFDSTLSEQGPVRKGSPRRWASPLTQELHRRFGCQFVFFAAGRHERPYGYVVIDHVNRNVVKGGEVLRMAQLIGPTASPGAMSGGMSEAGTKGREDFGAEEVQERGGPSPGLAASVDAWMQRIEEDARADMRQAGAVDRRRRKRNGAR